MKAFLQNGRVTRGLLIAAASLIAAPPAIAGPQKQTIVAQGLSPPAPIPDAGDDQTPDGAALLLRVERLESDLRRANGQIEELQNQNQRLAEELRRFREDVEFRLSGGKTPVAQAAPAAQPTPTATAAQQPLRKSDAFDPNSAPAATGAPMQLGTTPPSAPLDIAPKSATATPPTGPLKTPESGPTVIGSGLDFADAPRSQFAAAIESYKSGQYQAAEEQFKAFLAANAGNKLAPDAVLYLGETYLQRSRPREAAEQYLKLSTDYPRYSRAAEGMMRLGQALAMLGNVEQACATFSEVGRRYPTAPGSVKKSVEREMQKDHC